MKDMPEKPLEEMDDWELVALYRSKDNAAAFEILVFRYRRYLASVIIKQYNWFIAGDRVTIDDILNETWVRVLKKIRDGDYKTDKIFRIWVADILRNIPRLVDWQPIPNQLVIDGENGCSIVENIRSTEPSSDRVARDAEFHKHLEDCLSSLSQKHQKVLRMKKDEEMTNEEIGRRLGYSGVWIGKMLKKGYAHLAKCMKTKGHDISKKSRKKIS